jgi:N-methylhydantoinase A
MSYRLGIDVGGTFTDFIAIDTSTGSIKTWKNLSTPHDPTEGIIVGLRKLGQATAITGIRLGTTVATNALLERKGARVAYLTTRGFRDVPFIGRGNRRHHYDLAWVKPKPFVKRRDCHEIDERVGPSGDIIQPLDEAQVATLADRLAAEGEIETVAVVLLHSYLSPDHEQRIKAIFQSRMPNVPVSISYEVLPKWKEHFRSSTTICDAFIKPVVRKQLGSLRSALSEQGIGAQLSVMRSNGGEMSLDAALEAPIQITVSGPTGGVIAAKQIAELLQLPNLVTLDMGGTSTDVSAVVGHNEKFTTDFEIEWGRPIQIPMIDIRTIGAGGGSIARLDSGGMLVVGPQSAGASPGPACYGRGGILPTVTDANLVLGRLSPANFLGGVMQLDRSAARTAMLPIAATLDSSIEEAALAIVRIANNNMVGALYTVLTERGLDPRDFILVAYGGAGPLHVCDLMTDAAIPKGLVPNFPGQFSALGFTMADPRVDRYRTVQLHSRSFDRERASTAMATLVRECRGELAAQGHTEVRVSRAVEMRYLGQNYELEVPVDTETFTNDKVNELLQTFHSLHEARFGFRLSDHIEIVNFLVTATARTTRFQSPLTDFADEPAKARSNRPVWFGHGWIETPIYAREDLRCDHTIRGPAIIEESASVTVLDPAKLLTVDRYGNLSLAC